VKSIIGYPSPNKAGTSKAHGAALGEDEVRATKEIMGWDPDKHFHVPEEAYSALSMRDDGAAAHAAWTERFESWRAANAELAEEWDLAWQGKPLPGLAEGMPTSWDADAIATRSAGQKVMAVFEKFTPTMLGGAADLSESTKTEFPQSERYTAEKAGRNVFFGVREHGMGGAVNGMAAHGGIVRPYGSTFLQFADYMRGAIRLSALTGLPVAWIFTHDSVALGEDGPTHQPVEHLAALRAIPGLVVLRPADAPAAGVGKGAYVLADADDAQAVIIATGSEVWVALAARDRLDVPVRVVSMPSWELFEQQDEDYKGSVLPVDLPTVSVEAGVRMGWERYADSIVSIDRFGASAPGEMVLEKLGITPENVAEHVRQLLV